MVSLLVGKWHDGFRRKAGSHEAPNSLRRYPDGVRDLAPSAATARQDQAGKASEKW